MEERVIAIPVVFHIKRATGNFLVDTGTADPVDEFTTGLEHGIANLFRLEAADPMAPKEIVTRVELLVVFGFRVVG